MRGELPSLAVVIPVRNGADGLASLLPSIRSELLDIDVMVADAGSQDDSIGVAARYNARVLEAEGGRGPQMRAGVEAAVGDWILLLHADSRLPDGWDRILSDFMADERNAARAGYFSFKLDDRSPAARRLERMVAWRCRKLGLPYGDQGLLISRDFLEELGGVPALPLMEDVALVRRIGKERLVSLEAPLMTSAEKFRRDGYFARSLRNLTCLSLYFLGVSPATIRKLYG